MYSDAVAMCLSSVLAVSGPLALLAPQDPAAKVVRTPTANKEFQKLVHYPMLNSLKLFCFASPFA